VFAVAGVEERAVLLDGFGFALDRAIAAGAADQLSGCELLVLLSEAGGLCVPTRTASLPSAADSAISRGS
jgi:hypothetical protein